MTSCIPVLQPEGGQVPGTFRRGSAASGGAPRPSRLTKTKPCTDSRCERGFSSEWVIPGKALGLLHFRARLQPAVEFEGPRVIGAKEQPGVAAARRTGLRLGRPVPVVPEAHRHDVHGPVGADAGEDADGSILVAHDDQRLVQQFEVQEVPRPRDLRDMGRALPPPPQQVPHLPVKELLARVGGRGQRPRARQRQLGGGRRRLARISFSNRRRAAGPTGR